MVRALLIQMFLFSSSMLPHLVGSITASILLVVSPSVYADSDILQMPAAVVADNLSL